VIQRFRTEGRPHDATKVIADAAIAKWLTRRPDKAPDLSIALTRELKPIGAGYRASFHRMEVENGEALRWRFLIGTAPHIYLSTITIYLDDQRDTNWLWYDVETRLDDSHFAPPKLTKFLTDGLGGAPRDRTSQFTEGMRKVSEADVGDFLDEVLEAENRVVPAFVSGNPSWSVQDEQHVERALADLYGIATFWQLAPDAFDEFNALVRPGYRVLPGSIHAFQDTLDTEDELDVRRHWWFSSAEVRQSRPWELSRRLHTEAMRTGLHVRRPEALLDLNQKFERDAASSVLAYFANILTAEPTDASLIPLGEVDSTGASATESQPGEAKVAAPENEPFSETSAEDVGAEHVLVDGEIGDLIAEVANEFAIPISSKWSIRRRLSMLFDVVRKRLARLSDAIRGSDGVDQFRRQIETLVSQKQRLESENEELNELLEIQDQEPHESADTLAQQRQLTERERRRGDHLAQELGRLAAEQQAVVDWQVPDADLNDVVNLDPPDSLDDLFVQFERLQYVRFTGDRKAAETVRDAKLRDVILRDVWTYASELEDFARRPPRESSTVDWSNISSATALE